MAKTLFNQTINVGAYSSKGTLYSDYYSMTLTITEGDYDVANNTSPVTMVAKFKNNKAWQAWTGYTESKCPKFTLDLFDDKTQENRFRYFYLTSLDAKEEVTIFSETFILEHNSAGNLNIAGYLGVERQSQVYYFPLDSHIESGTIALTAIPRATKAVDVNCEVEGTSIIALQPYVATFTHSVKVVFGSISKYINASGNLQDSEVKLTNPTITFNVPTSFYGQFTGQNQSQNNGIEVRTYNGSTQIGDTQYGKLTVSCNETKCRPSISGTVTDSNTTTSALTGNINKLVKYYSTAYLNLTLNPTSTSGDSNTTITSRSVDGNTFSGTTYSIANATKSSFNVTLTNSRGYSNTVTVSASGGLVDYFKPKVIAEFSRTSQTADTVQVKYSVDIFNGSFGSQTNKVTVKAQVYQNDEWTDIDTLNTDSTSDITTTTVTLSGSYVYTSNFNFRLIAIDLLDTTYVAQLVTAGVPNFSHGKGWFQHHTDVYMDKLYLKGKDLQFLNDYEPRYVYDRSTGAPSWYHIFSLKPTPNYSSHSVIFIVQGWNRNVWAMAHITYYHNGTVTARYIGDHTPNLTLRYNKIDTDNTVSVYLQQTEWYAPSNVIVLYSRDNTGAIINPYEITGHTGLPQQFSGTPTGYDFTPVVDEPAQVTIATAKSGYTILDQVIYKQGKHYFGNLIVKKDSGEFNETQENVALLSFTVNKQQNSGCFLSGSQWNANVVGYLYIGGNQILVANYTGSHDNIIAKIPIDVVAQ